VSSERGEAGGLDRADDLVGDEDVPDSGGGKLADLGLSRLLRPGLTITGLGSSASVEFLDPALIRGAAPSRASDIFALGATLHRALTGKGLYGDLPRDNTMVAMRRVLSRDAEISAGLDPATSAVIGAAISTDPAGRPATAEEFAGRVEALGVRPSPR